MSITLPPLPDAEYNLGSEFERSDAYSEPDMLAYALAAVEAYIASRVPMTEAQIHEIFDAGYSGDVDLIRKVEAHHGIGAKP